MNSIPKEYNSIVAAGFFAALLCGGGGYFLLGTITAKDQAVSELEAVTSKIKGLQSRAASPTEAYLKELIDQKTALAAKIGELRDKMREIDLKEPEISPEDFPKSLNQKVRAFTERAAKEGVQIPTDFHLGFEEYQTKGKLPPKQLSPYMGRQLEAVSLLLDTFLETQPLELKAFVRKTPDERPNYTVPGVATPAPSSGSKKPEKAEDSKKQAQPLRASLWAESYQIEFTNRPERLRTFLNKLAEEKKAFFVVRSLKIANSQEFAPPKNPDASKGAEAGGFPPAGASTASSSGAALGDPVARVPTGLGGVSAEAAPTTGDSGSPYIVGEEHVVVQMTVDLVAVVPPVSESNQP